MNIKMDKMDEIKEDAMEQWSREKENIALI